MIPAHVRIFVCTEPIDFRRGFDGLALAARERLGEDPRAGGLFVFTNRRATGVKIVWLEPTGCCLLYKRLHQARVVLPPSDGPGLRIDGAALARLLQGVPRPARRTAGRWDRASSCSLRIGCYDSPVTAAASDLRARVAQLEAALAAALTARDQYKALYEQLREDYEKLKQGLLGQKAERVTPDDRQLTLALIETLLAEHGAPEEAKTTRAVRGHERAKPRGRTPLPAHLPRVDVELIPHEVQQGGLENFRRIGEEVSEVLERRRASSVVVRVIRPKFVAKDTPRQGPVQVLIGEPADRPICAAGPARACWPTRSCGDGRITSRSTVSSASTRGMASRWPARRSVREEDAGETARAGDRHDSLAAPGRPRLRPGAQRRGGRTAGPPDAPGRLDEQPPPPAVPRLVSRPRRCCSPERRSPGTSPRSAATWPGRSNRPTSSSVARYASAVTGPTPGMVVRRWATGSAATSRPRRASAAASRRSPPRAAPAAARSGPPGRPAR